MHIIFTLRFWRIFFLNGRTGGNMNNLAENVKIYNSWNNRKPKKLLDLAREIIRLKHYSIRTEQAYIG